MTLKQILYYVLLNIFFFALTNSVDTDQMLHYLHSFALCGISSGSSLFVKVLIMGFPIYKGLIDRFIFYYVISDIIKLYILITLFSY